MRMWRVSLPSAESQMVGNSAGDHASCRGSSYLALGRGITRPGAFLRRVRVALGYGRRSVGGCYCGGMSRPREHGGRSSRAGTACQAMMVGDASLGRVGRLGRAAAGSMGVLGAREWRANGRPQVRLVRLLLAGIAAFLVAFGVAAVVAVACEGTGGPPSSPPTSEQNGTAEGNPADPGLVGEFCGKPVNCATGNEAEGETDIAIGGRGPGLRVVRSYSALFAAEASVSQAGFHGGSVAWIRPRGRRAFCDAKRKKVPTGADRARRPSRA
jgi:hypothetical protein